MASVGLGGRAGISIKPHFILTKQKKTSNSINIVGYVFYVEPQMIYAIIWPTATPAWIFSVVQ